jgi:hypothetical protein
MGNLVERSGEFTSRASGRQTHFGQDIGQIIGQPADTSHEISYNSIYYNELGSAKSARRDPGRIEPARLENPPEAIADLAAKLSATSAKLGRSLHPRTAAHLAELVRIMNTRTTAI